MTRDTQVGLVVASAFVCLLGTVLALKMRPENAAESPPAATPLTSIPGGPADDAGESKPPMPPGYKPIDQIGDQPTQPQKPAAVPNNWFAAAPKPPDPTPTPPATPAPPASPPATPAGLPTPPAPPAMPGGPPLSAAPSATPPGAEKPSTPPAAAPAMPPLPGAPSMPGLSKPAEPPPPPGPSFPATKPAAGDNGAAKPIEIDLKRGGKLIVSGDASVKPTPPGSPPAPAAFPDRATEPGSPGEGDWYQRNVKAAPAKGPGGGPPPAPELKFSKPLNEGVVRTGAQDSAPNSGPPPTPNFGGPAMPDPTKPAPPTNPVKADDTPRLPGAPPSTPPLPGTAEPKPTPPPEPGPTGPGGAAPSGPPPTPSFPGDPKPAGGPPPLPTPPDTLPARPAEVVKPAAPASPPAPGPGPGAAPLTPGPSAGVRPAVGPAPAVDSFDEDIHSCKPGDSYRSISQQFYLTDKYEKALQRYNRDYPADRGADPALVQPGQRVRVPPIRVLMQKYPDLLGERPAAPPGGPAPSGPTPAPVGDVPAPPARLGPPVLQPPGVQTTQAMASPGGPSYVVVEQGGETIWAVAKNTLGSGQYWERIYRLNPSLNPQAVIPAGTRLRLPPEARVPQRNQP
jgi:hypothetical protein